MFRFCKQNQKNHHGGMGRMPVMTLLRSRRGYRASPCTSDPY